MRPWAELGRAFYALRFRLFDRRRHQRLVLERLDGFDLLLLPEVFHPALFHSSTLLAAALADAPRIAAQGVDERVLDLGTGSGYLALSAARRGSRVVAVDINPEAIRCARLNALLNRLEDRIELRRGDLFLEVADEQFDLVLFNPPFLPGERRRPWDDAWREPEGLCLRFATGLARHLTPNGRALLVTSSHSPTRWGEVLRRHDLRVEEVGARTLLTGERLAILHVRL